VTQHYPEDIIVSAIQREEDQILSNEKRFAVILSIFFAIILVLTAAVIFLFIRTSTNTRPGAALIEVPAVKTVVAEPTGVVLLTPIATPTVQAPRPTVSARIVSTPAVREYFIPFGTGTNQSSDWENVPGAEASVDFGGYRTIQKIVFEVTVSIPTANETASVRLFNVTDKHPVWNSEITTSNNIYTVSEPLVYDTGAKVYQVQMKTQLQHLAELTLARVHIYLK
jgi:hypothetical protein